MRTLASIRKVRDLIPIPNKDLIELAVIDGWQVIVKKDEFKIGDLLIYCEIDSVLPKLPEFEFLQKCNYRIKTIKMGGVLSQGICFPLSMLPVGNYKEGKDVTALLGVTQYTKTQDLEKVSLPPKTKIPKFLLRFSIIRKLFLKKKINTGSFPSFLSKTDENRIQNKFYDINLDQEFVATEKLDGQSGTFVLERVPPKYFWQKESFKYSVCSRNLRKPYKDDSSYWQVSDRYNIKEKLEQLIGEDPWVAIQGECLAPKVQGNKYKVKTADLYCFNLIYPSGRQPSLEAKKLLEDIGLKFVPIIHDSISLKEATVESILDLATFTSTLYNTTAEGLVFRSLDGTLSFKAVSPKFLLKHDE